MNCRKIKLLTVLNTVGLCIALFWSVMSASTYRIEIEMGRSLEPIIGRGAILITTTDPDTINIGDIVSVLTGYGGSIHMIRKVVAGFKCDINTERVYVHLVDGSGMVDWGWYPVEVIRTKVVCVVFRGFIGRAEVIRK